MSEAYLAIVHRAQAAKAYFTTWGHRVGDLKTVHEEYEDDLQRLRDRIEESRAELVRGGVADEMNAAVTRVLGYQEELTQLELMRDSTCEVKEETHGKFLEVELRELLGQLTRIVRSQPHDPAGGLSTDGDAAADTTGESFMEPQPEHRGASAQKTPEVKPRNGTADTTISSPPDVAYHPSPARESESEDDVEEVSPPPSQRRAKRKAAAACDDVRKEALALDPLWRAAKRRRLQEAQKTEGQLHGDYNETDEQPSQSEVTIKETITFEEVFGDGKAEYRHFIVQYPDKKGKFYILRCEEHGVHFKSKAICAAAKHLDTELHGMQGRKWDNALETLGVEVINCSAMLMEKNNKLLQKDINEGRYEVLNRTKRGNAAEKRKSVATEGQAGNGRPQSGKTSSRAAARRTSARKQNFEGVADPMGGELYLGIWGRQGWYALVLLPRGPAFGDPRFSSTGIPGNLRNTRLLKKVPACYKYTPGDSKLSGWAKGYEDGGPLMKERRFPVIFFDAEEFPGRCSAGWIRAKNLRPYERLEIPYLDVVDRYVTTKRSSRSVEVDSSEETSEEEASDESGRESESENEAGSDGGGEAGEENGDEEGEGKNGKASPGNRGDGAGANASMWDIMWEVTSIPPSGSPQLSANARHPAEENRAPSPGSRKPSFRSALEDRGASPHHAADQVVDRQANGTGDVYDISSLGDVAGGSGAAEMSTSGAADDARSAESIRRLSEQAMMALGTSWRPAAPPPPAWDAILNIDGTTRYESGGTDAATDMRPPPASDANAVRQQGPAGPPVWKYKYYQPPQPTTVPAQRSPTPPPPQDAPAPSSQSGPLPRINPFGPQYRDIAPGPLRNAMLPPPPPLFAQYDPQNGNWRA